MKNAVKFACLVVLLVVIFTVGAWYGSRTRSGAAGPSSARKIHYWHDPMHPAYKSDKPGIAPDCGMQLEPVYEGDAAESSSGASVAAKPGAVQISAEKQQLMGMRLAIVSKSAASRMLRVPGRVVPDETRTYRINAAVDGWVRNMSRVTTGSLVRKDELLASFYAPEFFSAVKAYLYGLRSLDRFEKSGKETKEQIESTGANIENYRNSLRNLGMTEYQLDAIARTRQGGDNVEIRAPAAGFVLERNLSTGQRFEKGTELYRIADLSRVWILADVFGREARHCKPGMPVKVFLPDEDLTLAATVSDVLPQFDAVSRTKKIRLEAANSRYELRPDMFVDVEFPVESTPALMVPTEAVVDTGLKKTVFVEASSSSFEPRKVETGARFGDRIEVTAGLTEGERIVVSGNFLLDSESRLSLAGAGVSDAHATDPVCGMPVNAQAPVVSTYKGQTYHFCCAQCKTSFDSAPAKYIR